MDLSKFTSAGKSYVDEEGRVFVVHPDGTERQVATIELPKEMDEIVKESEGEPFGFRR